MSLDYRHTCPEINRGIESFRDAISSHLADFLEGCDVVYVAEKHENIIREYSEHIYRIFEEEFELVRSTNTDLRAEAEDQIDKLSDDLDNANNEIKNLQSEISNLEYQLSCSEHEIYILNKEINKL